MRILVLSNPKCGRSTYCQQLSTELDLELIDLERPFKDIMKKIKKNEDEPLEDEEGKPMEFLTPTQRKIYDAILSGKKAPQQDMLDYINEYLESASTVTKGFVIDIPLKYQTSSLLLIHLARSR